MGRWFDVFAFRTGEPDARRVALLCEPREERVPLDDEPRAAHAAQRHRRLRRAARAGLRGPVTDAQRPGPRARCARANQHLRGSSPTVLNFAPLDAGQVEYRLEDVRSARRGRPGGARRAAARGKGLAYDHDGCGPETPAAARGAGRRGEGAAGAAQPADERGQVHRAGRPRGARVRDRRAAGVVRVRVTDTGRGIPADQLERVFEPFVQVDRHRTHASQQGVGLGLAISRDLARGMGGDLTAESTPGVGAPSRSRCRPPSRPVSCARLGPGSVAGHRRATRPYGRGADQLPVVHETPGSRLDTGSGV
jgi:hypothetical protein